MRLPYEVHRQLIPTGGLNQPGHIWTGANLNKSGNESKIQLQHWQGL